LPAHDFASARYMLSFGADFLESWLSPTEDQRGFAEAHGFGDGDVAKFVYVGPRRDLTGLNADEWLAVRPGTEAALALAIANAVAAGAGAPADITAALAKFTPAAAAEETGIPANVIERIAREFAAAKPSLAVAGGIGAQHAGATELCAAVNLLNYVAGNVGHTVKFGADLAAGDGYAGVARLASAIDAGQVAVLLVHDANPVYALPRTAGFAARLAKVPFKVSTALFLEETAARCDLLLPQHHALERWDDLAPRAGVRSLMQPVMEPVVDSRAAGDILLLAAKKAGGALAKFTDASWEARLRSRWQALAADRKEASADDFWRGALQRGGVFDEPPAPVQVSLAASAAEVGYTRPAFEGHGSFVFLAYPHPMLHDGRGTNKPWLLENADPVTKITWHSWVELAPEMAQRLNVRNGEILRLTSPHGAIEAPAYLHPGLRPDVVAMPLGFGHTEYGAFAKGRGVNALDLLGSPEGEFVAYASTRVAVEKTGAYKKLASIEGVPRQLGRGIAEAMPLAAAKKRLSLEEYHLEAHEAEPEVNTQGEVEALKGWSAAQHEMATKGDYTRPALPQWGMAIDLARCTGCQACVTACYAENNIPTIGEMEILKGREMTWMRIERYWEDGDAPGQPPSARFVPMLCQHCANAPCEPVCPVYAAYHTADGLNGQVYNRCVGTRYCANNCPYKVRYFNWYKYNEMAWPEPLDLQLNPDVTVRARGVMEKCTFCIQRIRGAQNQARIEDRAIRDGEFTTACAQACPSDAIVFGDTRDAESRVAAIKQDPRGYHVLEELNTRPAVTYLAKVLHPVEA
jgi:Fe-S-cluster-containing dehydrogenase component